MKETTAIIMQRIYFCIKSKSQSGASSFYTVISGQIPAQTMKLIGLMPFYTQSVCKLILLKHHSIKGPFSDP